MLDGHNSRGVSVQLPMLSRPALHASGFRWSIGAFLLLIGALLLVAPHEFAATTYAAIYGHSAWWGSALIASGMTTLSIDAFVARPLIRFTLHIPAVSALAVVAIGFTGTASWSGTVVYGVLSLATLGAAFLARPRSSQDRDLLSLTIAVIAMLLGGVMLALPSQFSASVYDTLRPHLTWFGLAFLASGLVMGAVTVWQRPPWLVWSGHVLCAAVFFAFTAANALPQHLWSGALFYGGAGVLLLLRAHRKAPLEYADPQSLTARLATALTAIAVLPAIVVSALDTAYVQKTATGQALSQQQLIAKGISDDLVVRLHDHQAAVRSLAGLPNLLTNDPAIQRASLVDYVRSYPSVASFALYDVTGKLLNQSDSVSLGDWPVPPQLLAGKAGDVITTVQRSSVDGSRTVLVATAIPDAAGLPSGLAVASSPIATFGTLLYQSQTPNLTAILIDTDGTLLAQGGQDPTIPFSVLLQPDTPSQPRLLHQLQSAPEGGLPFTQGNARLLVAWSRVPETGWTVTAMRQSSAALVDTYAQRDTAYIVLLFTGLLAVLIGVSTAGRLTAPLQLLVTAVARLGAGDAGALLPTSGIRELAQLSVTFAHMRQALTERAAERDVAEAALRQSEARYRQIVETAQEGIGVLDAQGTVTFVNQRLAAMLHSSPSGLVGRHWSTFTDPESLSAIRSMHIRQQRGIIPPIEIRLLSPEGRAVWTQVSMTTLTDATGQYGGLLAMVADINDRRRDEEQIEQLTATLEQRVAERTGALEGALKELEAFSYSVSHDLRAPLRTIDALSLLLQQRGATNLPVETRRYLQLIHDSAREMEQLITALLRLSHWGQHALELRWLEPSDLVRQAWNELRVEWDGRDVSFTVSDLPGCRADAVLLKQAFVNLLSNALKFTTGQKTVQIEVGHLLQGDRIVYFVRDNGIGFDMRFSDRLFQVFQRLHRAEEYEGAGIGLALTRRIVERHGGSIWSEATPGLGATFFFTLEGRPRALTVAANSDDEPVG